MNLEIFLADAKILLGGLLRLGLILLVVGGLIKSLADGADNALADPPQESQP